MEAFSFQCNFNKKPIQWHLLALPPLRIFGKMWHCFAVQQIHRLCGYSLIWWCFSTKFCTVSFILHISLISFEVSPLPYSPPPLQMRCSCRLSHLHTWFVLLDDFLLNFTVIISFLPPFFSIFFCMGAIIYACTPVQY